LMEKHEQFLHETLASVMELDPDLVSCDTSFSEQGVDSLVGLRFARKIKDGLAVEFDPEWLYDYPTIVQLANFLDTYLHSSIQAPEAR